MKRLRWCLLSSLVVMALLGVVPVGAAPLERTQAQEPVVHVVQPGQNLFRIALRYGTTVDTIMAANGLTDPHKIYAGQQLVIPGTRSAPALATADTYVVRPGDSLGKIAGRFGTTPAVLARLNGIANPSAIYPGQVLRLSGAAAAPVGGGSKRIVVDLSEQHLYAYQGDQLIYSFVASSGAAPSYTRTGEFRVQSKIPKAYGSAWNIWMPHWLGIYWAGSTENGIHALPILANGQRLWAGYLGRPVSYGCVVLGTYEAELLYNWAEIGTPVLIRY